MQEPLKVTWVQFLALFGATFEQHRTATDVRGRGLSGCLYQPLCAEPVLNRNRQPMTADDFSEPVHEALKTIVFEGPEGHTGDDVLGIVCFECRDMNSSHFGERKAWIYGPGCTCKTLDEIWWCDKERGIVNKLDTELASTQKWPVCYFAKEGEPGDRPSTPSETASEPGGPVQPDPAG